MRWRKLSRFQPYVRHAPYSWRPSEILKVSLAATIVEFAWESFVGSRQPKFVTFGIFRPIFVYITENQADHVCLLELLEMKLRVQEKRRKEKG